MADQGLSVMAIGGFMGTDPADLHPLDIGQMIADGDVRYFLALGTARGPTNGVGAAPIMAAVQRYCDLRRRPPAALVGQRLRLRRPRPTGFLEAPANPALS